MESPSNRQRPQASIRYFLLAGAVMVVAFLGWLWGRTSSVDRDKVYRIGYGNDAPFHFVGADGKPTGLAVELVQEAARRARIKLEWVSSPAFDFSRVDMWVLATVIPERLNQMHFTEPYLQAESAFLVRSESPVHDAAELSHARIACRNLPIVIKILKQLMPDAQVVVSNENADGFDSLADGSADAIFVDQHVLFMSLLAGRPHLPLRMLPSRAPRRPLALASTFASAAAADEVRKAMQEMGEDESSNRIIERWTFFFDPANAIVGERAHEKARVQKLWIGIACMAVVVAFMVGLVISSRTKAAQLRETRKLLREVANRVPGLVFQLRINTDGTFCLPYASEAIRSIYHVSPESVLTDGTPILQAVHPDDREGFMASIGQSARRLEPWKHQYRVRIGDGPVRWHSGNALPNSNPDGTTFFHGFVTDITETKAAEEAMQAFEYKIQQTQKLESLGLLAGGIAHDFNNILTGILGSTDLARLTLAHGAPAQEYLDSVRHGCLRAAELCRQMLAYSGKGRFEIRLVSLNSLVEETAELLRVSISKQAELRLHLHPGLPSVEADTTQIRQVVMNLVINASEAIGSGNGMISLSTSLVTASAEDLIGSAQSDRPGARAYVCLEVSDTGCGMSPENLARIFDPFFTTKFTGRGLGLAAVQGIVRGHKGFLRVKSELGRGTTFKVLLPAADGVQGHDPGPEKSGASANWRGEGRLLVVDDEEDVRKTLAAMLRKIGFTVVTARDGIEGLERFRESPGSFAAVLMDLTMPQMNGKQAFAELRKIDQDVRVVLMSGFNEEEAAPEFIGTRHVWFLQKPFEFEVLVGVLQRSIG